MTTKLAYQYLTEIDYASLEFNPDEPAPRPDAMYQNPIIYPAVSVLSAHFGADYRQNDVFIDVSTFICYDPSNLNVRISPDIYIAFGVETLTIERRKLYLPWEVGKPPDFVLEVGSESTAPEDVGRKPGIYARIGVPEYWQFDRSGGDLYGEPLVGGELVDGQYRKVELTTGPDGILKGYSPALGLYLCWNDGWLTFYDPATESYLQNLPEIQEALQDERDARQRAEGDLLLERAAREQDRSDCVNLKMSCAAGKKAGKRHCPLEIYQLANFQIPRKEPDAKHRHSRPFDSPMLSAGGAGRQRLARHDLG